MAILNIYNWEDYAIFRALQSKPIPSHYVWDHTRGLSDRFKGNCYNDNEYFFEEELFTYRSLQLISNGESAFHGTGMYGGRAVPKVDGTLGMSVGLGDFFSGRSTAAAELYFSTEKAEAYDLFNINIKNIEELIKNIKSSIASVNMLLRTSTIDQGYIHKFHSEPSAGYSEDAKKWWRVNKKLVASVEGGNRNPEALLNLLAESCGIQFGLVTTFVDLIASKGEDASYLGTPYWFAHTFKYSLDKRVARILLEKSLSHKTSYLEGYKASRELNSANTSKQEKDHVFGYETIELICKNTGWTAYDVGYAAASVGVKPPFTRANADSIAGKLTGNTSIKKEIELHKASQSERAEIQAKNIFENSIDELQYENIFQICRGAGWKFDDVYSAAARLGIKAPFSLVDADRIAGTITGKYSIKSAYKAHRKLSLESGRETANDIYTSSTKSTNDQHGGELGLLTKNDDKLAKSSDSISDNRSGNIVAQQAVAKDYKKTPQFIPSKAIIPYGFPSAGDIRQELSFALNNPEVGIRSFFNDLTILENGVWSESALYVPAFNESLYCKLVIEYHRYSITDLRNTKQELMKNNEKKGLGIGALLGVMAGGIMAPFGAMMGSNLGKIATNLGNNDTLIQEYLPDPHLLFLRDEGSFTHIQDAFRSATVKRRVCLRRVQKVDGLIYFDVFPMILMESQATPAQVFKWEGAYFMRPISAGLNDSGIDYESKLGYNPVKYRKSYAYHPRFDLKPAAELLVTKIIGETVEKEPVVFSTELREDRSFNHCYFDYSKDTQVF